MSVSDQKVQDAERGVRLRSERERLGLTLVALAERGGVSRGSQILYEKGNAPTADYLTEVSEVGVDVLYVLTGKRGVSLVDKSRPLQGDFRQGDQEYSQVRVFDIDASAGYGIVPSTEDTTGYIAFTRAWLIQHGIIADLAGLVRVRGDSMVPTIADGSYALVDFRGRADFSQPGIYILRMDDKIVVKRLKVSKSDGSIWVAVVSDNPAYQPLLLRDPDHSSFQPIGRVRASITLL